MTCNCTNVTVCLAHVLEMESISAAYQKAKAESVSYLLGARGGGRIAERRQNMNLR